MIMREKDAWNHWINNGQKEKRDFFVKNNLMDQLNFICIEKEGLKKFLYNETLSNFLLLTFLTYEELF